MENLILSKLENLKINNNNKNFYNRDKELYKFLLSKDFYDQVFKTLKINIPEDIKIVLINDLINQISEKKIRFFSSLRKQGDEAAPLPPSSEGGTKKNIFDESSLDINSLLKDYLVSLPKEPKGSCFALPSEEGDLLFIKNVDKKPFCASLLPKDGQEFVSTKSLIQEYILEEGFSYILGCIWKNGNIKTEYDNKLEFLNSKKKFLSSLSFPFTGEKSIDSVSYLSPALLSVRSTEKRENSCPSFGRREAQKRNLLLSFLHSKKKEDEIEYNLFCKETHTILKAIKEKFYNIDWLIEGKLCFIKSLPPSLPLLSEVVGYEKEKNKYSLKAKKEISKLEKVDYNWQGKTLLPSERRAASSPVRSTEEKDSKKKDSFFASFKEETKHSLRAKLKRLDIFYNYIEKRIEPGQFTSLLRKMINKRYKNIFLPSETKEEISQIKISLPTLQSRVGKKSRVENKPSCASPALAGGQENPSLDINYSSLKYRLIDIYLSIFDLFIFSLKKEYNSLTRYMSYMGRVLKKGKSKIGKKGSRSKEKIEGSRNIKMLQEQVFSPESHQGSSQKSGAKHFRCENCFATNRVSCKEEYKIRDNVENNSFLLFFNPCEELPSEDKGICISNHFSTFYNIYIIYLQFFEIGKNKNFMISPILYKDFFKFFDLWKESLKIGFPRFSVQRQGGGRGKHLESKKVFSNLNIFTPLYINTLPKEGNPLVFSPEGRQGSSQKSGAKHFRCENCFATNKVSCKEEYKVEYNVRSNEKDYLVCNKLPPNPALQGREGTYGKVIDISKKQSSFHVKNNFNPMIYQKTLCSLLKLGSDFIYFPINSNIKVDIIYYRFGLDFLIGLYGNYKTSQNLYRQIEDFLTENYYLSLEKHNLYNPSSNQTIFRNYQISFLEWKQYYRRIQSLTLYMGKNVKGNLSFLTRVSSFRDKEKGYSKFKYKIFLNLPILDIIRSLHKEGFCDGKGFPTSKKNWTILSDSRILKYFKNLLYSLKKYYSIIDYPKNWKKIEYILQHSCTMTIAHKHRTSLRKVITFYGKKMRLNTDHK